MSRTGPSDPNDPKGPNGFSGPRALHLFANFKWTGPADHAIRTAAGLRRHGVDVVFAQAGFMHGQEHRMATELRRQRIPVIAGLDLRKHYSPISTWRDATRLALREHRGDFDLLHAHLPSDHVIAALARHMAGGRPLLVRTIHEPLPPPGNLRNRFAFAATDGVVVPTESCAAAVARRFHIPRDRIHVQEPPTDRSRFAGLDRSLRREWGIGDDELLVGITARIQPHRRFPLLWDVAEQVVSAEPAARFILLGRGNEQDTRELVQRPLAARGLNDRVLLPGYLYEPTFSRALLALDLFLFLVPGSDGTCRAVREAMAAGVPVVATKRGILPDLLGRRYTGAAQEPCGVLLDEDPTLMAGAIVKLLRNEAARTALQRAALDRVTLLMDPAAASAALARFYSRLCARRSAER
jgi:glycosyltransferase involved in cell wall biosynthesis